MRIGLACFPNPLISASCLRIGWSLFLVRLGVGLCLASAPGQTYTPYSFITWAGKPGEGNIVDGTGIDARFFFPSGAAFDSSGNLLVTDRTGNGFIRRISSQAKVATMSVKPDRLLAPTGIAIAKDDTLYVADRQAHNIVRITAAGTLTLLAGSESGARGSTDESGAAARFYEPNGVAIDRAGRIYVADTSNHTIRRITPEGAVTTFAGTAQLAGSLDGQGTAARFNRPYGLAFDQDDNLFVAEDQNHTIRKITPDGHVTTVAGQPGRMGTVDGPGLSAQFSHPYGIAVDASGYIYVADSASHAIRRVTPDGYVTTLAGSPGESRAQDGVGEAARFSTPVAVAVDRAGRLFVCDMWSSAILLGTVPVAPAITAQPASGSTTPGGRVTFAVTATGNPALQYQWHRNGTPIEDATMTSYDIEFATADDAGTYTVAVANAMGAVTSAGASLSLTLAAPRIVQQPSSLAVIPGKKVVLRVVASGMPAPAYQWFFQDKALAGETRPELIPANCDAAQVGAYTVSVTNLLGSVTSETAWIILGSDYTFQPFAGKSDEPGSVNGAGDAARFRSPLYLVANATGDVYVSDAANHTIRRITPARVVTTFAGISGVPGDLDGPPGQARFDQPHRLSVSPAGQLYVVDYGNRRIRRIAQNGVVSTFARYDQAGWAPAGIAFDSKRNVFLAGETVIQKIEPNGTESVFAGRWSWWGSDDGPGAVAKFNYPGSLATDYADNLYVLDGGNFAIRKITPAGLVSTLAGKAGAYGFVDGVGDAARFNTYDANLAVDLAGYIYVADSFNGAVRQITPEGAVTTLATGLNYMPAIAVDPSGNLFITAGNAIRKGIPIAPPIITRPPLTTVGEADAPVSLIAGSFGSPEPTLTWTRNGATISGASAATYRLDRIVPLDTGIYAMVATNMAGARATDPVILGLATRQKVLGEGLELLPHDIAHPNGNVFDQVLMSGRAEAITADPAQTTRTSFVDVDDDIVQVEFSGPGTLSLVLETPTGPAEAANYNQRGTLYMKGHAGIVITGATEATNVSVFTVGRKTAINQGLFRDDVSYDGIADLAFIAIASANGKFGGVRTANVNYFARRGLTGIYAPGVVFTGPVYIGDITAFETASPVIRLGESRDVRIAGGDLGQANQAAVQVSGIDQLTFTSGTDSHGRTLPAQANSAKLLDGDTDVTNQIVRNP